MHLKEPYSGNENMTVGNGSTLPITHIGSASLPSSQNSKSLQLSNILFVPHITKSLLSISKFTQDNDVFLEFHSDCCFVKDKCTRRILLEGRIKDGLYLLDLSKTCLSISGSSLRGATFSTHNCFNAQRCVDVNLWHSRLGHPCSSVLNKALTSINVPFKLSDIKFCDACAMGKIHSMHFPTVDVNTSAPFQLIHTDVWGSILLYLLRDSNIM